MGIVSFDVATDSALPLTLGVMALVGMPAAIAAAICADDVVTQMRSRAEQVRESWHEQRTLDRLERAFDPAPPAGPPWVAAARVATVAIGSARETMVQFAAERLSAVGLAPAWLPQPAPVGPPLVPFEEIVDRLRELPRDDADYDQALRDACQCLGIDEHLTEVDGLDLQIERVRVEGALIAAGVVLAEG
ncbi:hypothetical protein Cci01nite_46760 [Catellatospora citrea]|uniref:Uncharacterized protein n=2 Tax=Catellatospora citrea TaxID=53366 RepID=A0A8J3P0S6_9ACTN|nr:hypothetical protein C8E86_4121 [Catellatospora citrea]GIF99582.1 hypothetical protein Cci01nite_46760 [Catellatospora citrea]